MKTPTAPAKAAPRPRAERAPGLYAVIPAAVLFDAELEPMARLIYGAVSAMAAKTGEAWPTNKYLATMFGLSADTVSRLIAALIDRGHLNVRIEKGEGNTRYLEPVAGGVKPKQEPGENAAPPIGKKAERGYRQKSREDRGEKAERVSAKLQFPYKADNSEKINPPLPPQGGEERAKRARAAGAAPSSTPGWLVNEVGRMQTELAGFLEKHPEVKATPAARKKHPKLMPLQMATDAALDLLAEQAREKTRSTKAVLREELQLLAATMRDAANASGWRGLPLPDLALRLPAGVTA